MNNGQEKLRTSGSGKLKEVIYSMSTAEKRSGKPDWNWIMRKTGSAYRRFYRASRSSHAATATYENIFVNGRYVKSAVISKAAEDAYRDFVMQHKFPFAVLHFHCGRRNRRRQCPSDKDGASLLSGSRQCMTPSLRPSTADFAGTGTDSRKQKLR